MNSSREALVRSFQLAFSLRSISLAEGGPLPPSSRRSLFILATSMIIFSSKAYNILSLVPLVKATLTDKRVDPFLCLVEERKLQIVDIGPIHRKVFYGSQEDNSSALKFFSEIEITEDQMRESLATVVVKSLDDLSDSEVSTIREQLLDEFLPDDVCPLGAQLFMDVPQKIYQCDSNDHKPLQKAAPIFAIDEDVLPDSFPDSFESNAENVVELAIEIPDLLSVNQLLESVLETAHQVGRISVSTALGVSYKEMSHQCEALLVRKQQKMSHLMSTKWRQESLLSRTSHDFDGEDKWMTFYTQIDGVFQVVDNPFLNQNVTAASNKRSISTYPMLCATEYQHHPQSFRLPASSPYDNFLKAARC